ncbi:MAG TPA: coproporphyrinogen-III oxidase family protein [Candidatus Limnocylindrales bacterium]|nr:coproporphyrinogen-III oxidase family protein [Candidatus Limnocylindrales bacterium]
MTASVVPRVAAVAVTDSTAPRVAAGAVTGPATAVVAAPRALYIHVPFCVSVCPYCDFVVFPGAAARGPRARLDSYVEAVTTELELRADAADARFGAPVGSGAIGDAGAIGGELRAIGGELRAIDGGRPPLRSVYLGGGTPSLLPAGDVARLLATIERRFGLAPGAEVTIEVNPGPDDRGDLAGFRAAGVTRVSIGAQSLDAAELRRLGRRHGPEDVAATVTAARRAGFASITLDLLYDLPEQTLDGWQRTLDAALRLRIDHLSAYALTLDDPDAEGLAGPLGDHVPLRRGARRWRIGARAGQDEARAAEMYALADERLHAAGFRWYELSNWARPGHESRHNLAYWWREPYEAVGVGAHAFDGAVRRWNAARLDGYLGALGEGHLPPGCSERLGSEAIRTERLLLGLRLAEGIAWTEGAAGCGRATDGALAWARENGLLEPGREGRVRLTLRGRLLLDEILARAS